MAEIIEKTGKSYNIFDKVNNVWNKISFWHKASDCEFDDGKTAQTKVGAINGITSDLTGEAEDIAASIKCVNQLNSSLEKLIKVKVITLDTTSISPNDEAVYYLSQFYAESEYTIASVDVTYNEVNFSSSLVSNFLDDKLYIKNIGSNEVKNLVPTLRILFVNN